MAMGQRQSERQAGFWVPTASLPQSPGHPFYEQLNQVLAAAGFDRFCEERCRKFYAAKLGRPSVLPGVYFRMLLVGYFKKLPSERQIAWRCADSLSLRAFLGLAPGENAPDDSSLNRTRLRIDLETHQAVFDWGAQAAGRARAAQGSGVGRGRFDAGSQRGDAFDRAAGDGAELPGVLDGPGQGFRDRDADGGGPGQVRSPAPGQEVQQ